MSMSATPDRPTPHSEAYSLERRWADIRKHISWMVSNGFLVRPGHVANTYGGGMISKTEVLAELSKFSELGGSAK